MTSAGEALCGGCGLCCDGTLFRHVDVEAAEIPRLRRHLPLAGAHFLQPCPAHSRSEGCLIYSARPAGCVRYRCRTLASLQSGSINFEEAAARVRCALELADAVRAWLPPEKEGAALFVACANHLRTREGRHPAVQGRLVPAMLSLLEVLGDAFDVAADGTPTGR